MLTSFARSFSTSAFATLRTSKNVVVGPGQLRLMSSRTPNGKKRIPSGVAQTPNEIIADRELPVTVLWTIGDASAAKLKAAGIHHLSHLLVKYAEDPGNFQPFLQGLGIHYWIDLRAFHPRKVLVGGKRDM